MGTGTANRQTNRIQYYVYASADGADTKIQSKKMDRHEGSMWQDYLSELLDNRELVPLLSDDVTVLLKQHYHNWGNW